MSFFDVLVSAWHVTAAACDGSAANRFVLQDGNQVVYLLAPADATVGMQRGRHNGRWPVLRPRTPGQEKSDTLAGIPLGSATVIHSVPPPMIDTAWRVLGHVVACQIRALRIAVVPSVQCRHASERHRCHVNHLVLGRGLRAEGPRSC